MEPETVPPSQTGETKTLTSPSPAPAGESWTIEGLDKEKGLAQFGNSEDMYRMILKSYVDNTPDILEQIRTCTESQLPDYAVMVHGIKGTSYAICAAGLGKQAEALELAARRGDFQFVSEQNAAFINGTEALIERINAVLQGR